MVGGPITAAPENDEYVLPIPDLGVVRLNPLVKGRELRGETGPSPKHLTAHIGGGTGHTHGSSYGTAKAT